MRDRIIRCVCRLERKNRVEEEKSDRVEGREREVYPRCQPQLVSSDQPNFGRVSEALCCHLGSAEFSASAPLPLGFGSAPG